MVEINPSSPRFGAWVRAWEERTGGRWDPFPRISRAEAQLRGKAQRVVGPRRPTDVAESSATILAVERQLNGGHLVGECVKADRR